MLATLSLSCAAAAAERAHEERGTMPHVEALVAVLGCGHGAAVPRHAVMVLSTTSIIWPSSRGNRDDNHGRGSGLPRRFTRHGWDGWIAPRSGVTKLASAKPRAPTTDHRILGQRSHTAQP